MVTIGLDPHPDSHTVAALEDNGTTLAFLTVKNDAKGLVSLHRFALPFPERRWAVEGAANRYILPFVSELLEDALSRYGLLAYFLVYAALAFGWRALMVYRNTGVNPFVLPSGDDAYGYVGRAFKVVVLLLAFVDSANALLGAWSFLGLG